jgi:hypothetical protein
VLVSGSIIAHLKNDSWSVLLSSKTAQLTPVEQLIEESVQCEQSCTEFAFNTPLSLNGRKSAQSAEPGKRGTRWNRIVLLFVGGWRRHMDLSERYWRRLDRAQRKSDPLEYARSAG